MQSGNVPFNSLIADSIQFAYRLSYSMKFPHFRPPSCLLGPKGSQEEIEMLHPE